jgi:deoxyribonuclease-4
MGVKIGVHTSIAGGLENAAHRAREIGCDTFQMFSANPRGWRSRQPSAEACARFRQVRGGYGLAPVVIHDNYLINLASASSFIRRQSLAAFRGEIERALELDADYLVTHPGSARDTKPSAAIRNCIESLCQAAGAFQMDGLIILIENTAGQGSAIGRTFEEVAEIIEGAERQLPVGVCIDTAHCFAAGYRINTAAGLKETLQLMEKTVGLAKVKLIHANDSKTDFDSHADRHEHIGRGKIGLEGFRRIVRHPKLRNIPFICETPVDRPGDDRRNLNIMRKLAGTPRQIAWTQTTTRKKSK